MSAQHTPGPWRFYLQGDSTRYIVTESPVGAAGSSYDDVAHVDVKRTGEGEANARLIAAAPELLAALRECEHKLQGLQNEFTETGRNGDAAGILELRLVAKDAIAKAVQP